MYVENIRSLYMFPNSEIIYYTFENLKLHLAMGILFL